MRLITHIFVVLGSLILLTPVFLYFFPYQEPAAEIEQSLPDSGIFLQEFNYDHWDTKGSVAKKEYTVSGKVLRLKDKNVGPFQFAFLKELAVDHPQLNFYNNGLNNTQLTAGQALLQEVNKHTDFINSEAIAFTQNPVLANVSGRTLACDTLIWNKAAGSFKGEGNCQLQLEDRAIQAPVIIIDKNLTVWQIQTL